MTMHVRRSAFIVMIIYASMRRQATGCTASKETVSMARRGRVKVEM
jgi:hypothetical protein